METMQIDPIQHAVALIVEDHDAVRVALRELIQLAFSEIELLEARSVDEALQSIGRQRVDVVLMDIGLPGTNGVAGTRLVLERSPATAVIMVSNFDDANHRAAAGRAGARAFVSKRAIGRELIPAIERVISELAGSPPATALTQAHSA